MQPTRPVQSVLLGDGRIDMGDGGAMPTAATAASGLLT
jgi:hypothetical protein